MKMILDVPASIVKFVLVAKINAEFPLIVIVLDPSVIVLTFELLP